MLYISAHMEAADGPNTTNLLAALGHPTRRRILKAMAPDEEVSPRELSRDFDLPLSMVSYHVRVLAECGALELVRTAQVRGATQHFYRSAFEAGWARSALAEADDPRP